MNPLIDSSRRPSATYTKGCAVRLVHLSRGGGARSVVAVVALMVSSTMVLALPAGAVGRTDQNSTSALALAVARAARPASWTTSEEVPGSATLNVGGTAVVTSIACPNVGDCSAVGTYALSNNDVEAFVANETNGTWASAEEIPGFAGLNVGNGDLVTVTVSCATVGNCSAGGGFTDSSNYLYPFVVSESNGTWGSATQIGDFPIAGGDASGEVLSTSCFSAGNCVVGGVYGDGLGGAQAFVADETGGSWGNPAEVPGTSTLNTGASAEVTSVSCASGGVCAATGSYTDSSNDIQGFGATSSAGNWSSATELPGLGALNVGGEAVPISISCAGDACAVGGTYALTSTESQAFVANETNGTWGSAIEVPGTSTLDAGLVASTESVSCASATSCTAGGAYTDGSGSIQAFVANETNGTWASAVEVPGTSVLNIRGGAAVIATSCGAVGYCAAVGIYTDAQSNEQSFVVNESAGIWGAAIEVPGSGSLNADGVSDIEAISCAPDGACGLGGYYTDGSNDTQALVDSSAATLSAPSAPRIRVTSKTKTSLTITLTAAVNNGGESVTGYQYSLNGGGWKAVGSSSSTSFTVQHLAASKTYHVRLRALSSLGDGSPSASTSVKIK
jgi:hypothetical protein